MGHKPNDLFPQTLYNARDLDITWFWSSTRGRKLANFPHSNVSNLWLFKWRNFNRCHFSGQRFDIFKLDCFAIDKGDDASTNNSVGVEWSVPPLASGKKWLSKSLPLSDLKILPLLTQYILYWFLHRWVRAWCWVWGHQNQKRLGVNWGASDGNNNPCWQNLG